MKHVAYGMRLATWVDPEGRAGGLNPLPRLSPHGKSKVAIGSLEILVRTPLEKQLQM